ncbi:hypothetical protein AMR41_09770 [Hapalosiphon sp. MRB220]|nr:hypothetical protein AMR41_09770 [Hapalosiphon sp. MRB220]
MKLIDGMVQVYLSHRLRSLHYIKTYISSDSIFLNSQSSSVLPLVGEDVRGIPTNLALEVMATAIKPPHCVYSGIRSEGS